LCAVECVCVCVCVRVNEVGVCGWACQSEKVETFSIYQTSFVYHLHKMADQAKALADARAAMIAKRFGGNDQGASTGGSGTMRRKNKGAAKTTGGSELV
jgi:hypothetical protein